MRGLKKKKGASSAGTVGRSAAPPPTAGSSTTLVTSDDGSKWTKVFLDSHSYKTVKVSPNDTASDIIVQIQQKLRAPSSKGRFAIYKTAEGVEKFCPDEDLFMEVLDSLPEGERLIYQLRKTQDIHIFPVSGSSSAAAPPYELGVRSSNRPTSCFVFGALDEKGKEKEAETTWGRGEKRMKWKDEEAEKEGGEKKGERKSRRKKVNVVEDFVPENEEGMEVKKGMVLEVLKDEAPEDWLRCVDPETKKKGLVPKKCVKSVKKLSSKSKREREQQNTASSMGTLRGRRRMRQLRSQMQGRISHETSGQLVLYIDGTTPRLIAVSDGITTLECIAMGTPTGCRKTYFMYVEEEGTRRKLKEEEVPLVIQTSWPSEKYGKFLLLSDDYVGKGGNSWEKQEKKETKNKTKFFPEAVVMHKFCADSHHELDLEEGDHVFILENGAQGWVRVMTCPAKGRVAPIGKIGLAPKAYLKRM